MKRTKLPKKKFRMKILKAKYLVLFLIITIFCASIGYSYWGI